MAWIHEHWVELSVLALAFHTFLKAIRDAFDKTPQTDDNFFEKFVTISGKVISYLAGQRAK